MYILEARNLGMIYGAGMAQVHALRGIDLQVSKGELLAIMGPSGSGKSTLLYVLGGMVAPTSGQVLLDGVDIALIDDDRRTVLRRKRLGFVFQAFNLLPILTVEENVQIPLLLDNVPAIRMRKLAEEVLEWVGMAHRSKSMVGELSGGEQQRVAIARALAIDPMILLADEPTGNLDRANGLQIASLLKTLVQQRRQTVVLVTHDANIAAYADRIVRLFDGRIVHDELQHGKKKPQENAEQ